MLRINALTTKIAIKTYFPKEEIRGEIAGLSILVVICLFVVFNEKNKKIVKDREEE